MKRKVSKLKKKHNFCNTDNSQAATRYSTKKAAPKNSAIPTRKLPCRSLSAINSQALRCVTLSKRDTKNRRPPGTAKSPRTHILKNTLKRLLLIIDT